MYKHDTGLTIICLVNKACGLFCLHNFNIPVQILFQADLMHEYTVTNNLDYTFKLGLKLEFSLQYLK